VRNWLRRAGERGGGTGGITSSSSLMSVSQVRSYASGLVAAVVDCDRLLLSDEGREGGGAVGRARLRNSPPSPLMLREGAAEAQSVGLRATGLAHSLRLNAQCMRRSVKMGAISVLVPCPQPRCANAIACRRRGCGRHRATRYILLAVKWSQRLQDGGPGHG